MTQRISGRDLTLEQQQILRMFATLMEEQQNALDFGQTLSNMLGYLMDIDDPANEISDFSDNAFLRAVKAAATDANVDV